MVAKVLALGLYGASEAYLRDAWNIIDTIVVLMGWASLSPSIGNISAMRTVRVLRPLRTITGVEGMRMLVATLTKILLQTEFEKFLPLWDLLTNLKLVDQNLV